MLLLLSLIGLVASSSTALAQQSQVLVVSKTVFVPAGHNATVDIYCPTGFVPSGVTYQDIADVSTTYSEFIDAKGVPFDLFASFPASVSSLPGGGHSYGFTNTGNRDKEVTVQLFCTSPNISTDQTITVGMGTTQILPRKVGTASATCDPGQVAIGGIDNANGSNLLKLSEQPVFNGQLLGDVPDGSAPAPTGWQSSAFNLSTTMTATFSSFTYCVFLPSLQTFIASVPLNIPGANFAIWNGIPSDKIVISAGFDGGSYGLPQGYGEWDAFGQAFQDWVLSKLFGLGLTSPPKRSKDAQVGADKIRAVFTTGVDTRPPQAAAAKASTRATLAVLVVPSPTPPDPINRVTVIEFYNQARDHFFISSLQADIDALDSGHFPGWVRTGQTFNAYGIGSGGPTTRRPVCRYLGSPAAGLDSHFYSASLGECLAVAVKFAGAWLLEAAEVMEIDLPDPDTGACPAGDIPVYRLWNNRADSNHRYTTSTVTRDQMLAKGYLAEGYGPGSVALCALP
jgi:hypothetical protein